MTQQHGRRYEHELVNGLDEITPPEVWLTSAGYSGNSKADDCDIVITVDPKFATRHDTRQFNIEAKRRQAESGKRVIAFSGSSGEETACRIDTELGTTRYRVEVGSTEGCCAGRTPPPESVGRDRRPIPRRS